MSSDVSQALCHDHGRLIAYRIAKVCGEKAMDIEDLSYFPNI